MNSESIRLEEREGILTLTLNRPEWKNAISVRMVDELKKACVFIEDESRARAVVIRGAGKAFSVGINLRDFPEEEKPKVGGFSRWEQICRTVERIPKITIAAVDGECAGGGLMLALACDVRVATDRSFFHLYEVPHGFIPGMGTFRLAKYVGFGRAKRMALTGRQVGASEAEHIGLIDHLCPAEDIESAIAKALAEFDHFHPDSLELTRRLLEESYATTYENFIGFFLAAQHRAIQTEAFKESVKAAHHSNAPLGDETKK